MILEASDLSVQYPGADGVALDSVSVTVNSGELVAVVGPNGSGKTTMLGAILGTIPKVTGTVMILGRPHHDWSAREMARRVGVVTQREETAFPLRVAESVGLGRYARLEAFGAPSEADNKAVADAMQRAEVTSMASRQTDTLSGGEWQRVRVARALAQEPQLLVLDEPTAALDIRHEMQLFELVRRLCDSGMATLLVTHHLNLAARYADRMLLLHRGRLVNEGTPTEVLQPSILADVFEWPVAVSQLADGAPQVVPLRSEDPTPQGGRQTSREGHPTN